ncbi:MAG TPA: class II aldolase/adducin family protein [Candidatus Eisenbacteria bacterium]|jgi:L-fuculose-phosphate aldolase
MPRRRHPEEEPDRDPILASGRGKGAAAAKLHAVRTALAHDLVRAGQMLDRLGMIVATEGNLSARLGPDRILISRRGRRKGELSLRDFVELSLHEPGDSQARMAASTEHRMHLAAYTVRPDIEALIHAHPIGLSAYAVRGGVPDVGALDEAGTMLGRIGLVPFHPSGSDLLAHAVAAALVGAGGRSGADVLVLAKHGALAVGTSVEDALCKIEIAEHLAVTLLYAERRRR